MDHKLLDDELLEIAVGGEGGDGTGGGTGGGGGKGNGGGDHMGWLRHLGSTLAHIFGF